jgi:hypothetical protein
MKNDDHKVMMPDYQWVNAAEREGCFTALFRLIGSLLGFLLPRRR